MTDNSATRRPVLFSLAMLLGAVSLLLALVPTAGGTTSIGTHGHVGGGDCGSSFVESLSYRRWTADEQETYGCLPETAPRVSWALLAVWAGAALVVGAVLRRERPPLGRRIGYLIMVGFVVLGASSLRAMWLSQQ